MLIKNRTFSNLCFAREILAGSHGDAHLSIPEVAKAVGISPFHFIRQFEAVFGTTPHQFRIAARLERAKRLLVAGELPVTEVCLEVGFSSLGSFSHMFKRRVGVSPSAYGRRSRALVATSGQLPRELVPGCFSLMEMLPVSAIRSFREARASFPWQASP